MDELKLREKIKKEPDDAMNYYYLGKELSKKPITKLSSIKEIENLFEKSIVLAPKLWAPRVMLGELLYKQEKYNEAEKCFRELLKIYPNSVSAREHLAKCICLNSKSKDNSKENTKKDFLYLFENDVREFIKLVLNNNYKDWWREGVPKKLRAKCAARREEGLEEEKDVDLLFFADFYDYKEIIENNKKLFASILDIKEWCTKLNKMEPVRNAIAHNRPLPSVASGIKDYYLEFQKVIQKVRKNKILFLIV